jgi:hypothetical protein
MKKFVLLLILLISSISAFTQSDKNEKVSLDYMGIAFEIPADWRNDPYSASSVCDCQGVIIDHLENELRINIYPTNAKGMQDPIRDNIWSYTWDAASAKPFAFESKGKTLYTGAIGHWIDNEDEHIVIRLDANLNKQYARIFIFGPEADLLANKSVYELILNTFQFTKPKKGR